MTAKSDLQHDPVTGEVVGGLLDKAAAQADGPSAQEAYWRQRFSNEPYYLSGRPFEDYRPAYELGWSGPTRSGDDFDAVEPMLARNWERQRASSTLTWPQARPAARAAWLRAHSERAGDPQRNRDVIEVLNELIEACRDGEAGFEACAEHLDVGMLKRRFYLRATQYRDAAAELGTHVLRLGGLPDERGTVRGAVRRGWMALRGSVSDLSEQAMLEECERGEDVTLARYRSALKQTLPNDIQALLKHHMQGAQKSHDEIKQLRDEARSHA